MVLTLHLLGSPRVERDGVVQQAPRGRKVWGLLAFLALSRRPVSRAQLCSLLFAEADDPLAALRWNLTEARRVLGSSDALVSDPVSIGIDLEVDVDVVTRGAWDDARAVPDLGADLLEGMSFPTCPSYDVWLESQRRHVRGATEAMLREGALTSLTSGDPRRAAQLASRLVTLNPLDENFQALLVRSLAASGDGVAAARQAAACRELFRRELGVEPGPTLSAAAATVTATPTRRSATGPAAVAALTEAGTAAIRAGALDAGLDCLRRAVADAETLADERLQARALTALGTALVHAARGRDEEGATALHQALALAGHDREVEAEASRELGYVEFLTGRYDRVDGWLGRAERAVGDDAAQRARVLSVRGSTLSDLARYDEALEVLERSCATTDDDRLAAYSWSMVGRVHLLRGALEDAAEALDTSLALTARTGNTAFGPWPQSLRATVHAEAGEAAQAHRMFEEAFAMSCHLGDPCWEGISARGLGLLHAGAGDVDAAVSTLRDARRRCTRLPDGYLWLDAYTLDALCDVAITHDLPDAGRWSDELLDLAARSGMRELVVRALIHRARLGDDESRRAATDFAADMANPALDARLASLL